MFSSWRSGVGGIYFAIFSNITLVAITHSTDETALSMTIRNYFRRFWIASSTLHFATAPAISVQIQSEDGRTTLISIVLLIFLTFHLLDFDHKIAKLETINYLKNLLFSCRHTDWFCCDCNWKTWILHFLISSVL